MSPGYRDRGPETHGGLTNLGRPAALPAVRPRRYADGIASGARHLGGALLSGAGEPAIASQYRVKYKVIPPGVGPDDYESADLEDGETVLELPDPEPAFFLGNHLHSYGPPRSDVIRALAPHLPEGACPIIRSVEQIHGP